MNHIIYSWVSRELKPFQWTLSLKYLFIKQKIQGLLSFKSSTQKKRKQWHSTLLELCLREDIQCIDQHLSSCPFHFRDLLHWEYEWIFRSACAHSIELVRYFTSKRILELGFTPVRFNDRIPRSQRSALSIACYHGRLDIVKYLLTSPELIEAGHTFMDLHVNQEDAFHSACRKGHLHIVQYLLTSPELIEAGHTFVDLHSKNELGLRTACQNGHLNIVQYLLTAFEIETYDHIFADLSIMDDEPFLLACEEKQWHVVQWLVLDYKIPLSKSIENIIQNHPQAQEYFRAREENLSLEALFEFKNEAHGSDVMLSKKIKKL